MKKTRREFLKSAGRFLGIVAVAKLGGEHIAKAVKGMSTPRKAKVLKVRSEGKVIANMPLPEHFNCRCISEMDFGSCDVVAIGKGTGRFLERI